MMSLTGVPSQTLAKDDPLTLFPARAAARAAVLASTTSLLALFAVAALPGVAAAQSACVPDAPADGDAVVCSGTGTGIVDDGLDDATIEVLAGAVIDGGATQAFEFDDGVTFTNAGTLSSTDDHAVQGDNDVTVTNTGTITGGDGDGVNIDDNGTIINSGTITGGDDGVQTEIGGTVINTATGVITAAGEGVNVNQPDAVVINDGIIEAVDDAINAGTNATITNTGRITSTGDQDGVDLDFGTVTNSGLIESLGSEDGIDFDPSTEASTVTNSGTIRGTIAINTDPADTGAQTVVNSGSLIGLGGTAVNLGAGDDVLVLQQGSVVEGAIEMGDGADTLEIAYTGMEVLTFGSAIETVTTAGPAVVAATGVVLLDDAVLSAEDRAGRDLAFGLSRQVLVAAAGAGVWASGFGIGSSADDEDVLSGAIGYDHALGGVQVGGFLSRTGAGDLEATLVGLRLSGGTPVFGYAATVFTGETGGDDIAGSDGADGTLTGVAGRLDWVMRPAEAGAGLDLALEGGFSRHEIDGYDLDTLATRIDGRDVESSYLRLELGVPMMLDADTRLRGFVAVTGQQGDADAITASFGGASASFDAEDDLDRTAFSLGGSWSTRLASGMILDARLEASVDDEDETGLTAGFGLRLPL